MQLSNKRENCFFVVFLLAERTDRMKRKSMLYGCLLVASIAAGTWTVGEIAGADQSAKSADAAVERARREVRLLDDVYKSAIVLITKHYVTEKSDLAAGDAFKALFS